jgi:eukaryotic-like serine/threonine-protein kinase
VFVGVSVDDVALSKPLIELKKAGFKPKRLYWLTNRLDNNTNAWAATVGLQLITYHATTTEEHQKALDAICSDLRAYHSIDVITPPLSTEEKHRFAVEQVCDDPALLAALSPDVVRINILRIFEDAILGLETKRFYTAYYALCEKYDYAIKTKAFYVANGESFDELFKQKVVFPELGQGNFGKVYQANNDENCVAIKIMHPHIINNEEILGGFRRGIESMRIITRSNVKKCCKAYRFF